jgi:protein-tyrosine phosphatase
VRKTGQVLRPPVRVCFVCSGNICRSPTAQVVLDHLARESARDYLIEVNSAGTGSWHEGEDMDARSRRELVHAGYDVPRHVAAQFQAVDFATTDVVVALDSGHFNALWWLAAEADDPAAARAKLVLLRAFDPQLQAGEEPDVADPYYGGDTGFAEVLAQSERSGAALLDAIEQAVIAGAERVRPPHEAAVGQQPDSPPL